MIMMVTIPGAVLTGVGQQRRTRQLGDAFSAVAPAMTSPVVRNIKHPSRTTGSVLFSNNQLGSSLFSFVTLVRLGGNSFQPTLNARFLHSTKASRRIAVSRGEMLETLSIKYGLIFRWKCQSRW
jgi:hypothetical protein